MKKVLMKLRGCPRIYGKLKKIYGYTIGLWPLKEFYLKHVGLWNGKKRVKLLEEVKSDNFLYRKIKSGKPFMLARFGSTEFRNLTNDNDFDLLCRYSGFFPEDESLLEKFRNVYMNAAKKVDYLAVWNYRKHFFKKRKLIKKLPNIKYFFPLSAAGGSNHKWIKALKNKKILVIHPFKKTILKQHKKREKLGILPKIKSLQIIKAVQTLADNKDPRFDNWFEALDWMKKEIDKKNDFDVAIIGCGAYGMPLAAHIKSLGKQSLHLGGGTQLLFGIKGKRWENNPKIRFNEHWTYPLKEDTPKNHKKIEGGCYWGEEDEK